MHVAALGEELQLRTRNVGVEEFGAGERSEDVERADGDEGRLRDLAEALDGVG